MAHSDEQGQGTHIEIGRYWVRAIGLGTNSAEVANVAGLIHAALNGQTIVAAGYGHMVCSREERRRYIEVDGGVRWQHMGGIYEVWQSKV
jgi:hypothetical protein